MPSLPEIVTLVVDGQALQGWQTVAVTRAAEAAAIHFSLAASNPAWSAQAKLLRRGRLLEIYTSPDAGQGMGSFSGGDLLCTGHVDEYEVESAVGTHEVGISGRSKAGDAIDCPPVRHKTGLVENKDLKDVATEFDEWKIGFQADVALPKLPEVQLVPGQSMFQVLEREARHLGVLLTGQPDGSVKITRAGSNRHAGALVHGEPPCGRWKLNISIRNKRSAVHVRGQRSSGTDRESLRQEEVARDGSVGRHRPYILFNEGDHTSKELKRRGQWERLRRSGSGISIALRVSTWRDDGGQLWQPGHLVPVVWDEEEIDQDLAVKSVTYNQAVTDGEGGGTWADLTLVDPRTLGGKAAGSGSGSGAGGGGGSESEDFAGGLGDDADFGGGNTSESE
ncbi:phage baseplate assembly protein [uncultured Methylobacterium sp.]|uniref:phage baseplate assembly protein n=1 Tax=uncultured Methylobacterium sp. TaxID=157278 RepID=UPI0035CCA4E6